MVSYRIHAINHDVSFRCHFFPRRTLDIHKALLGARLMKLKLKQNSNSKVKIKMYVNFDI